jgi:Ca2+-binding RTX toxin-like protein
MSAKFSREVSQEARVEPLESRQLLSVVLNGQGTLRVVGTPNADVIDVTVNADESVGVDVNGNQSIPFSNVKRIHIFGRAGADQITVDESAAATLLNATIHGGAGNDTITAGNEDNFIRGESGNDMITAGNGNNVIHGGYGADDINVGNGSDIVLALGANNTIVAGTGNDTLVGGNHSSVSGGGGDDLIWGVNGHDTLIGNTGDLTGADTIYTSGGVDDNVQPGPDDVVNPGGRKRPDSYRDYLIYLESLEQVPPM